MIDDTGAVAEVEDLAALGSALTQDVGGLALEAAHLVFLVALDLVGHGKVAHGVAAQVEGVKVSGSVFRLSGTGGGVAGFCLGVGPAAWGGFVMTGSSDEVSGTHQL